MGLRAVGRRNMDHASTESLSCQHITERYSVERVARGLGGLEPGSGFVLAIGVTKTLFEDAAFGARSDDLHGNQDEEEPEIFRAVEVKQQSGDENDSKDVDGAADL